MNCTLCHLHPSRPGTDRCPRCSGVILLRLPRPAADALRAILARHDGLTAEGAIAAALILQDKAERGDL